MLDTLFTIAIQPTPLLTNRLSFLINRKHCIMVMVSFTPLDSLASASSFEPNQQQNIRQSLTNLSQKETP